MTAEGKAVDAKVEVTEKDYAAAKEAVQLVEEEIVKYTARDKELTLKKDRFEQAVTELDALAVSKVQSTTLHHVL